MRKRSLSVCSFAMVLIGAGMASWSAMAEEITATALYDAYQSAEIVAEDNYNGSQVTITGVVSEVKQSLLGDPVVLLEAGSPGAAVSCKFSGAGKAQAAALHPGDRARLNCTVDFLLGETVHLSGCTGE